jgi:WXG100 family type VII secretion target
MAFDVDTDNLKRIASNCEQRAQHFDDRRRIIMQQCDALQGTWQGVSARGFQSISSEWLNSSHRTSEELRSIARKLRELAEHYERLDREERRRKRKKDD